MIILINLKKIAPFFLALNFIFFNLHISLGQELHQHQEKESLLDHLTESVQSNLVLEVDVTDLFLTKKYREYKNAVAHFTFEEDVWTDSIYIKARGVYRNRTCDNPPLKLKYPKKSLKKRGLKKQNELKLVYPCKNDENYQNYVLREYLVYKMYNILTENSLRVQLIDFTLKDALNQQSPIVSKGFLIEHREEIIKRLGAIKSDLKCMRPSHLSNYDYTLFQVFQFFIGNTDWLLPTCKNSEIISLDSVTMIPIPYDFDFSGMVSAEYATPQTAFGLTDIKERYFLGHKKKMEDLLPVFEVFQEKQLDLIQLVNDFDLLPKEDRKSMIRYINSFYKVLKKPAKVKRLFVHPMAESMAKDF